MSSKMPLNFQFISRSLSYFAVAVGCLVVGFEHAAYAQNFEIDSNEKPAVSESKLTSESKPAADAPVSLEPTAEERRMTIPFAGWVQFVHGQVSKFESDRVRTPVQYQTLLYQKERFVIDTNSFVKLVTKNECVAVVYGEGQLLAPTDDRPWKMKADAVRWICPSGQRERINFRGVELQLSESAEIYLEGTRLHVITGSVSSAQSESGLVSPNVYEFDGKSWKLVQPAMKAEEIRAWENKNLIPRESALYSTSDKKQLGTDLQKSDVEAKPEKKSSLPEENSARFILTGGSGVGALIHDNSKLSEYKGSMSFVRGMIVGKYDDFGVMLSGQVSGQENASDKSAPNAYSSAASHMRLESNVIEFGIRESFDRWWSPYARVGYALQTNRIYIQDRGASGGGYFSQTAYDHSSLILSGGFDISYSPKWLNAIGIYAAVEGQISRTLFVGDQRKEKIPAAGVSSDYAKNERSGLFATSVQIAAGTFLQF